MSQYWEATFWNGDVVTSADCAPWDLPKQGIVAIIQPSCVQWPEILVNGSYWVWRTDLDCWEEHDADIVALVDLLQDHAPVIGSVRLGKWISKGEFRVYWLAAQARLGALSVD